jgi:hypothetical protein
MSRLTINCFRWVSLPLALALIVGGGQLSGQDRETAKPAAKTEKKEKSAGRLPPHYGQVVTKEQREKIYSVQAKYADQIEKLLGQVSSLEKMQTEEIEAVLSQEQRDQVMKLASEAKSKRSKKTEKVPDADSGK